MEALTRLFSFQGIMSGTLVLYLGSVYSMHLSVSRVSALNGYGL